MVAAGALLAGGGNMIFNSLWETSLQQHIPPAALSRVSAYDWFGSLAFQPLGLVLAGPAAAAIGTSATLWIATAVRSRWQSCDRDAERAAARSGVDLAAYSRGVSYDALRRRARAALRGGAERAGARAHFRAMGIDPARLDGPIVGIASTWTGTMPCNLNQLELAEYASRTASPRPAACRSPFNTIAVSDNQSQGTPGMRASLISREVIADSIELMAHAHDFDALVCLVGCDKTVPAALMALARSTSPRSSSTAARCAPAACATGSVTIQDVWEAVGAEERGLITARRARRARAARVPGRRARAPATSPRTRWRSRSTASASPSLGDGLIPADELDGEGRGGGARRRARRALAARGRRRARSSTDARS